MDTANNPTCETHEASISALIDGELETPEQLPAIDHLLECASCQDFYGRARVLGDMVAFGAPASTEPAPAEVWDRIVTETAVANVDDSPVEATAAAPFWRKPGYLPGAFGLAAGLVLAIGLWLLRPVVLEDPVPERAGEDGVVNVVLEQDRGSMSDERFLELTMEVLRADRDYHRKMLQIMSAVDGLAVQPEGSSDEPALSVRDGGLRVSAGEDDAEDGSSWSGTRL